MSNLVVKPLSPLESHLESKGETVQIEIQKIILMPSFVYSSASSLGQPKNLVVGWLCLC